MANDAGERLYSERVAKSEKLKSLGFSPHAIGFQPDALSADLTARFGTSTAESLVAAPPGPFSIAGRIVSVRDFGKAAFIVIVDDSGALQVYVKRDRIGENAHEAFKLLEVADFVGVRGTLFKSKTGELTLAAATLVPLTKALRTLPGKFSKGEEEQSKAWAQQQALADVEERYRHRYVDLLSNPEVKETFRRRSRLVSFVRDFLNQRGYLEVETPMMHALVSGATARPFSTHHNALDVPLYLRIAPELFLKRLVVGGFHRVYEMNRSFRNEGVSTRHNPEFTMLEFYQAFATYETIMELLEAMFSGAAVAVTGSAEVPYGTHTINFAPPWPRLTMTQAVQQQLPALAGADCKNADVLRAATPYNPELATMRWPALLEYLFEVHVEPKLIQPTFITQFPIETSPLARRNDRDPDYADRFELFCAGREVANAFNELADPVDQAARFRAQVEGKAQGNAEAMDFDADYIRALEHGLPPTAGCGVGIDRLAMLLTNQDSIREVILFPLMRPSAP